MSANFISYSVHALPPGSTLFPYTTLFRSRAEELFGSGQTRKAQADRIFRRARRLGDGPSGRRALLHASRRRSEEHTSELQSQSNLVCRLLLEKKKHTT